MYPLKLKPQQQQKNHTPVCKKEIKLIYFYSVFLNYLTAVFNKQTSWHTFIWHVFQGFYAVYRVVFELLAEEDYEFLEDKDSNQEIPGFGRSDSPYETVRIVVTSLFKAAGGSCQFLRLY